MLHIYEFEIYEHDGHYLAIPFDLPGGTQGDDFNDACESAADWLQIEMDHRAMHDIDFPKATFGNKSKNDGAVVAFAIRSEKSAIPRMTPAEAARRLGVSRARVSQMIDSAILEGFELDGRTWITENSVRSRLSNKPKAGRPKKKTASDEKHEEHIRAAR